MSRRLNHKDMSFICPVKWNSLSKNESGKYCDKCSKTVYDLSDCTVDDLLELQKSNNKICGMIKVSLATAVALGVTSCDTIKEKCMVDRDGYGHHMQGEPALILGAIKAQPHKYEDRK